MKNLRTKIRNVFYIILIVVLMFGCSKGYELKNSESFKKYEIIEIEGCEYINWGVSYNYMNITHKGNCKNH